MISREHREVAENIIELLKAHSEWVVLCHNNPDGDTLGSGLALYSLALRLGKKASIIGSDPLPSTYDFMPFSEDYQFSNVLPSLSKEVLVICVDTSTESRTINGFALLKEKGNTTINIDHHIDNEDFCSLNLVVPEASATGEIITALFKIGDFKITKEEAIALYVALVTDNGNFRHSSTTARSHNCASYLLNAGVNPAKIDDYLTQNLTKEILYLWAKSYLRTELLKEGQSAIFWLKEDDFLATGVNPNSLEGLVNVLLRIKGVFIAVLIYEFEGMVKLSVRAREPFDARKIASTFGGGGHKGAAGAISPHDFLTTLSKLRSELNTL